VEEKGWSWKIAAAIAAHPRENGGEIPLFEGKAQVVGGRKFAGQKPLR